MIIYNKCTYTHYFIFFLDMIFHIRVVLHTNTRSCTQTHTQTRARTHARTTLWAWSGDGHVAQSADASSVAGRTLLLRQRRSDGQTGCLSPSSTLTLITATWRGWSGGLKPGYCRRRIIWTSFSVRPWKVSSNRC